MNLIVKWLNILDISSGKVIKLTVQKLYSGQHHIITAAKDSSRSDKVVYGRIELDLYTDTTIAVANSCIL